MHTNTKKALVGVAFTMIMALVAFVAVPTHAQVNGSTNSTTNGTNSSSNGTIFGSGSSSSGTVQNNAGTSVGSSPDVYPGGTINGINNMSTPGSSGTSGTGTSGTSRTGTSGTSNSASNSSGTSSSGTSSTTPGLPNTGAGGDVATYLSLLLTSAVVAVGGGVYLTRRYA